MTRLTRAHTLLAVLASVDALRTPSAPAPASLAVTRVGRRAAASLAVETRRPHLGARAAASRCREAPTASLSGATHRLRLDFGRETGTWMPPRWSQSGRHEFTLDVRTEDDGTATIVEPPRPVRGLALATGIKWAVDRAAWRVDQDRGACTLRMVLEHQGLEVSDCVLDPGELSLAIPFFPPATISRKEGLMSIIAYRFVVRKERRLVGVWFAEPLDDASAPG
mmetsp:Transcript_22867/g.71668  ORF Transcript_22867/g.71668 Transcript_22867/m.71668 type:complete len:223 (+) Transcript_22867:258-926(+)